MCFLCVFFQAFCILDFGPASVYQCLCNMKAICLVLCFVCKGSSICAGICCFGEEKSLSFLSNKHGMACLSVLFLFVSGYHDSFIIKSGIKHQAWRFCLW